MNFYFIEFNKSFSSSAFRNQILVKIKIFRDSKVQNIEFWIFLPTVRVSKFYCLENKADNLNGEKWPKIGISQTFRVMFCFSLKHLCGLVKIQKETFDSTTFFKTLNFCDFGPQSQFLFRTAFYYNHCCSMLSRGIGELSLKMVVSFTFPQIFLAESSFCQIRLRPVHS